MDTSLKLKFQQYKLTVKQWEDEFMRNNGKIPSRNDIKSASNSVRYAYKRYHALKIGLLQTSGSKEAVTSHKPDITDIQDIQCSKVLSPTDVTVNSPVGDISTSKISTIENTELNDNKIDEVFINISNALQKLHSDDRVVKPPANKPKKDIIPVYSSHLNSKELNAFRNQVVQKPKPTEELVVLSETNETDIQTSQDPSLPKNVTGVWGNHLNKFAVSAKESKSKVRNLRERTASFQLMEKLFEKSQFKTKRNPLKPRVPLRRSKSECFSLLSSNDDNISLPPDVSESQPAFEHEDQDPFECDLFSTSKCKVVIKDSSKCISQTSVIASTINQTKHSLDIGWISRCTDAVESSPVVDFAAQMQKDQNESIHKKLSIMQSSQNFNEIIEKDKHIEILKSSVPIIPSISTNQLDTIINCPGSPELFSNMETENVLSDNDNEIVSDSDNETQTTPSLGKKKRKAQDSLSSLKPSKQKAKMTKTPITKLKEQERLEKKVSEGRVNENFVRVNLKKKIYVRGRKNTSYSKYKKMMYNRKQIGDDCSSSRKGNCFHCGESGHWANKCPKSGGLLPVEEADAIDDSPYLTLEEAGALADETKLPSKFTLMAESQSKEAVSSVEDGSVFQVVVPDNVASNHIEPLYPRPESQEEGYLIDTPLEVWQALKQFGYSSFRTGQEEAVMRILSGMSTLVMLSTGAGKSLCYQLPAYLYAKRYKGCIALVVSPLVSLMEDQVDNLPKPLRGACLHMNQSPKQRQQVEDQLKQGLLHILLVSPETVVQSERQGGLGGMMKHLPPISFACVDEAHCVSQWSHNFRPAYLMLCKVLREKLKINTVLGLTATATGSTAISITKHLNVPDGHVISDLPMPSNLVLSVSRDENRDIALMKLLQGERFSACDSIIIYCIRREECERIAGVLRTCLKDPQKRESNKSRALSWNAEAYHAGLTAFRRKQVQQAFMSGKLRIVVATVAFGMGINKNNLRAVIHYNMPSSFERFVQEVGRAGRDGVTAHCHLFLDSQGKDLNELRRHIYADSTDRHVLRKLLLRVFKTCKCKSAVEKLENWDPVESQDATETNKTSPKKTTQIHCPGHEIAFLTEETVQALDLPEENILTLLCYLELHPKQWLQVLSPAYVTCKVISYAGCAALKAAAKKCPPLAMAVALDQKAGISHEKSISIEFPVVEVSSAIGWDSGQAKRQLKQLEWRKENDRFRRSSLVVQFSGPGLRVLAKGCLPPEDLDEALDWLMARVEHQESSKLWQLEALFKALTNVSYSNCDDCLAETDTKKCETLKDAVKTYFSSDENQIGELKLLPGVTNEEQVRDNVCAMISTFSDTSFTGRSIARIFHGIASPCFPSHVWGRTKYWRVHLNDNFPSLCKIATSELLRLRS